MQELVKNIMRLFGALVLVMLTSSCTPTVTSVTTTGCTAFGLIYPSRQDTTQTKRQVLAHNLTYEEICNGKTIQKAP